MIMNKLQFKIKNKRSDTEQSYNQDYRSKDFQKDNFQPTLNFRFYC